MDKGLLDAMPKLTYTTVQLVRIEDKFLATLHYVLMLVIFVYIIVSQAIRVLALFHLRFELYPSHTLSRFVYAHHVYPSHTLLHRPVYARHASSLRSTRSSASSDT